MGPIPALEMAFTNEQLLTNLRDVEVLAEDVLSDKQVSHVGATLCYDEQRGNKLTSLF